MERRDLLHASEPSGRCPACGAIAPAGAPACPACREPLAPAADDDAPLPPLPDGGLATLMPAWLRDAPEGEPEHIAAPAPAGNGPDRQAPPSPPPAAQAAESAPASASATPERPPVGDVPATAPPRGAPGPAGPVPTHPAAPPATFDPASLIAADDLPAWLRALGAPSVGGPPAPAANLHRWPAEDAATGPVYLPRAEPRAAAGAADPGNRGVAAVRVEPAGAGPATDRSAAAAGPAVPGPVVGSRAAAPDGAAPVAIGDDGAPLVVAIEPNDATTGNGDVAASPVAATLDPAAATTEASATGVADQADRTGEAEADGLLQEGVAAGIATIAILIVAAVIVFVIWRATTGP